MPATQSLMAIASIGPTVMAAAHQVHHICRALHYVAPAATLLCYLIATTISVLTLQNLKLNDRKVPRKTLFLLASSVLVSYMGEAAMLLVDTFMTHKASLQSSTDSNVSARLLFLDRY